MKEKVFAEKVQKLPASSRGTIIELPQNSIIILNKLGREVPGKLNDLPYYYPPICFVQPNPLSEHTLAFNDIASISNTTCVQLSAAVHFSAISPLQV